MRVKLTEEVPSQSSCGGNYLPGREIVVPRVQFGSNWTWLNFICPRKLADERTIQTKKVRIPSTDQNGHFTRTVEC
jgi:hypothetical protein